MRIEIKGLAEWRQRIERADLPATMAHALAERAEALAETVKQSLSQPPGAGGHDTPWLRSGALRDSIAATTEGLEAAVGSSDSAAAPQEMGTSRLPPRPFLAPAAASAGSEIASAVGRAVQDALKGDGSGGTGSPPAR